MEIPVTLVAKLGSIAVHAAEMISPHAHDLDRKALETLLTDPEVRTFCREIRPLVPEPRGKTLLDG